MEENEDKMKIAAHGFNRGFKAISQFPQTVSTVLHPETVETVLTDFRMFSRFPGLKSGAVFSIV
ncbi:hypothetical protein [Larkinella sp.]|uniref:hypothetical protein n=1 Tax=Larkinella sp. TaxID=2034517 RepID=UPI003BABCA91